MKGGSDYFLAGRRLSWWVIGRLLVATDIGGTDLIGVAGAAYRHGLAAGGPQADQTSASAEGSQSGTDLADPHPFLLGPRITEARHRRTLEPSADRAYNHSALSIVGQ